MKVACVYLARPAEGLEPLRSFLKSYTEHEAGVTHRLVVVYKGADDEMLQGARAVFADVPHERLETDDDGYDIGAYIRAAKRFEFDYMCFLNTFSRIEVDGWLGRLLAVARRDNVGMVAATGSYESLGQTYRYIESVIHEYKYNRNRDHDYAFEYTEFLLRDHAPDLFRQSRLQRMRHRAKAFIYNMIYRDRDAARRQHLERIFAPGGFHYWTLSLGSFPNVHLRTNAFMIGVDLFNGFDFAIPGAKYEANAFESGQTGISARIRNKGLDLLMVGADGIGYDAHDWPRAGIYRSLGQRNLLVSDNQTRGYDALLPSEKLTYQFLTWGNAMTEELPPQFPMYGLNFDAIL